MTASKIYSPKYLDDLAPYLRSPQSVEYAKALRKYGTIKKAAAALGVARNTMWRAIQRAEKRVASAEPGMHATKAPEGYVLRGVSTLLDRDGNVTAQWVKTAKDKQEILEDLRAEIAEIAETGRGVLPPLPAPTDTSDEELAVYPIADAHVGMLAWGQESGEDYDLGKAEDLYRNTFDQLVSRAPATSDALLLNLGDYYHTDGRGTTTKGTAVDSDSRPGQMMRVGVRMMRHMVDRLLQRHKSVRVIVKGGNHDNYSGLWLGATLTALYEREPRVTVSDDPAHLEVLRFGACLIGAAHGDKAALRNLPSLMASKWPRDWGVTEHRHWYTGHIHHDTVTEHPGVTVETLRTLTPKDSYSAARYDSGRDLKCDIWHKSSGRVLRLVQAPIP